MNNNPDVWWGDFAFELGQSAQWEIGPTRFVVQRLESEWLVASDKIDPANDRLEWRFFYRDNQLYERECAHVSRFVFQKTTGQITILPTLADRSVVSRPTRPITVSEDQSASIYISTPLWFQLAAGSPALSFFEIPISRPSDTWFGPSTLEGERCYAIRTYGRLNLKNLTVYPYRAITQVNIRNESPDNLLIERLNLPVPYLSLYQTPENTLWTETVTVIQKQGTSLAEFDIEDGPPAAATGAELISAPRIISQRGMLIRAFGALTLQGSD